MTAPRKVHGLSPSSLSPSRSTGAPASSSLVTTEAEAKVIAAMSGDMLSAYLQPQSG